ncbi:DUF1295 domain-containing protein [Rothia sp. CCM 9417]|uniref:DUF1295 domain-containing protein n=1 Tax=unclassified Rothia (in: high G+C Gram-positive bacteria) TaxID=2689056 RepID=UPI003AC7874A
MSQKLKALVSVLGVVILISALVASGGSYRGETLAGGFPLFASAVVLSYLIQWLFFIPAYALKTEKFYDAAGGVGFVGGTLFVMLAASSLSPLAWLLGAMVILWSLRLSLFLLVRVMRSGGDGRFDDIKTDPVRFFIAWTLQGLWVAVTASAAWAVITSGRHAELGWVSYLGVLVWLVGMALEITADVQKSRFKADPAHRGDFIQSGVWSVSRHPNYLGEILVWVGVLVTAAPLLVGWQWVTILSPVVVVLLLTKVSGIPKLEARADERWGGQEAYEEYKRNTPVLIPGLKGKN